MIGAVTAVAGVLFDVFGKSADKPLGVLLTGPVGAFFAFFALVMFIKYPDDRNGLYEKEKSE